MSLKKILTLLMFVLIVSISGKVYSIEPNIFVQSIVTKAAETLGGNFSKDERMEKLKIIAKETIDIRGIGFYSLGSHRKNLTQEQKKEYSDLFEEYFLKSFSSRLAEYSDPKILIKSQEKLNDNYTIVKSALVATEKRPEVEIDWRVYTKNPESPLIRDLIIEGLSLARTQKEEFNSIIQGNDENISALFSSLRKFINE
jgi:phospholipid transport system substrate-binding protein